MYGVSKNILEQTALTILSNHRGILAADESSGTITKRFDKIGVESTEANRRAYRELLFTTPGIGQYIGGVIMFDETIRQATSAGVPFVKVLEAAQVVPGIKVDQGTKPLAPNSKELITQGLDGLAERLAEYRQRGARFAKWRAVINIDDGLPTAACLEANAGTLAEYARLCQEADLVPIVEPEVLMDGVHSQERCFEVTVKTERAVFKALKEAKVILAGMLLKPNMILPGEKAEKKVSSEQIAGQTVRALRQEVPAEVPGIVFLSGGQSEEEATVNLNVMNARYKDLPWKLSFSYGRALQASALKLWAGRSENVPAAQQVFLKRARLNSLACAGKYQPEMEKWLTIFW